MLRHAVTASLLLTLTAGTAAESMTVFGGNADARACFDASLAASRFRSSSRLDLRACDRALAQGQLHPDDRVATHVNRGIIHSSLNNHSDALRDYDAAIRIDDTRAEAFLNRGNVRFLARHLEEALDDYERALALEINAVHVALLNRGLANENLGYLSRAERDYLAALEHAPAWRLAEDKLSRVREKITEAQARP